MRVKARMYDAMISNITYTSSVKYEEVRDARNNLMFQLPKLKTTTLDVNIEQLLAEAGIIFDRGSVEVNVTGFKKINIKDCER